MQHAEDFDSHRSCDSQYYAAYNDWNVHRTMLSDKPRMDFYKSILTDPGVVQGKVVVDVGSGTGILSAWAALSGADHVISLEASAMATAQALVFEENGVRDRVTVLETTVEALVARGVEDFINQHSFVKQVLGGIALLVSEWMGFYLFHEGMLPSVLLARDFFNQVNAALGSETTIRLIPSCACLKAAPISLEPYFKEVIQPFWSSVEGVRMSSIAPLVYEQVIQAASPMVESIPPSCLLHEGEVVWTGDLSTLSTSAIQCLSKKINFEFAKSQIFKAKLRQTGVNTVDGFVLWFEVSFGSNTLYTSPVHPSTHWKQTAMLLPYEYRQEKAVSFSTSEDTLGVTFTLTAPEDNARCYALTFELN